MKNNSLNLIIYEEKHSLEEEQNNLKNLCQTQNYHFLFYSIQEDNYMEMAKDIAKELFTSSFFIIKKSCLLKIFLFIY